MSSAKSDTDPQRQGLAAIWPWLRGWWSLLIFGAELLVLALTPSSWRASQRRLMLETLYRATVPMLSSYCLGIALVALVVIRIVLSTAQSYGLTQYALDMLVRTLVLELIPLSATLFAAVRYTLPAGEAIRALRRDPSHQRALLAQGLDTMRDQVLPQVLAGVFAALTLTALSVLITLVLSYLSAHGFNAWALPGFTRAVGHVFGPVAVLIFCLKTLGLALAVAIIPLQPGRRDSGPGADVARLARLLAVVLVIELLSLVGNYY